MLYRAATRLPIRASLSRVGKDHMMSDEENDEWGDHEDGNALVKNDPRLKAKWRWSKHPRGYTGNHATKWIRCPGQCSEAPLKNGFELQVTRWNDSYEAELRRHDEHLHSDLEEDRKPTRLEAQIAAENLAFEYMALLGETLAHLRTI